MYLEGNDNLTSCVKFIASNNNYIVCNMNMPPNTYASGYGVLYNQFYSWFVTIQLTTDTTQYIFSNQSDSLGRGVFLRYNAGGTFSASNYASDAPEEVTTTTPVNIIGRTVTLYLSFSSGIGTLNINNEVTLPMSGTTGTGYTINSTSLNFYIGKPYTNVSTYTATPYFNGYFYNIGVYTNYNITPTAQEINYIVASKGDVPFRLSNVSTTNLGFMYVANRNSGTALDAYGINIPASPTAYSNGVLTSFASTSVGSTNAWCDGFTLNPFLS